MEVHAVDVDDVGGFLESLVDVAVFEDSIPDTIGAGFVVQQALVFQGLLGVDHRIESFVFDLHQLGGIVGESWGFGHHRGYRLALIAHFGCGQRIIFDLGEGIGTDFDEGLGLGYDLGSGQDAGDAGELLGG